MDIEDFYKQAKAWQRQQGEAERLAEKEFQMKIAAEWKLIAGCIRKELPIEGMTIHETSVNQFGEFPQHGVIQQVDCQIDPSLRDVMKTPPSDRDSMKGIIRVRVINDASYQDEDWHVYEYEVWVDGASKRFDRANEAFIAVYEGLQV
jgi:hypothetical protein